MVNTRTVLWEGKDPDVLSQTYNLAQVSFDWRFVIINILSCFVFLMGTTYLFVMCLSSASYSYCILNGSLCHFLSADCSGNGVAVAVGDCGSRCTCSVRWTGTCCETRRPWRNWGDPHLETLDGRPVLRTRQNKIDLRHLLTGKEICLPSKVIIICCFLHRNRVRLLWHW